MMNDTDLLQGILNDLPQEPDRSLAIVAASYLDDLLQSGLRERLRGSKKELDSFFGRQGFLDSFGARTMLARAIGFIDEKEYHDMELIRRIRNDFAHIPNRRSFEALEIADRCNELKHGKIIPELGVDGDPLFRDSPRQRFIFAASILALGLMGRYQTAVRIEEPDPPYIPGDPPIEADT
jgi:mannitol operon repressor